MGNEGQQANKDIFPADTAWQLTTDLLTTLTIDTIPQSLVGKVLDAIREGGFNVEINVGLKP